MFRSVMKEARLASEEGIAIGPILFVAAILAVLVAAIAAGSSGFNTSTTTESNRIVATTVIQQGMNLRSGVERLLASGKGVPDIIVSQDFVDDAATTDKDELAYALYSTTGGGLTFPTPPSNAVSASNEMWRFVPDADLNGIGLAGTNDFVSVLPIGGLEICKSLNGVLYGNSDASATTPDALSGAPTVAKVTAQNAVADTANAFSTSGVTALSGRTQGCVDDGSGNYYYYTLLTAN